jgi:predicted TIM-barrel fold metal-dependent hydrolase
VRIDVHAHYTPPSYIGAMAEFGAFGLIESFDVYGPGLRADRAGVYDGGMGAHLDRRIVEMDAAGIDISILSLGAVQPTFPDRKTAASAARAANDMLAAAVDHAPHRFRAFAALPLPHVRKSLDEIARVVSDPRFAGFGTGCSACGVPLDDARMTLVWERLDADARILYLHPGATARMGVGGAEYTLPPAFGGPAELAFALGRLIAGGTTTRFPDLHVVAGVLGGSMTLYAHRFEEGLRRSDPDRLERVGGVVAHLRRMWFDTSVSEEPEALRIARDLYGAERIVFGSDAPARSLAAATAYVTQSPALSSQEKTAILETNAPGLLRDVLAG